MVGILVLSLTGCGSGAEDAPDNQDKAAAETPALTEAGTEAAETAVAEAGEEDADEETLDFFVWKGSDELLSLLDHFEARGLAVESDGIPLPAEVEGAVDGVLIAVEGGSIELWLFDPATAEAIVVQSLEKARQTGIFVNPYFGSESEVSVNGNIMMMVLYQDVHGTREHPAKDRVIDAFMGF